MEDNDPKIRRERHLAMERRVDGPTFVWRRGSPRLFSWGLLATSPLLIGFGVYLYLSRDAIGMFGQRRGPPLLHVVGWVKDVFAWSNVLLGVGLFTWGVGRLQTSRPPFQRACFVLAISFGIFYAVVMILILAGVLPSKPGRDPN
jgi:hypothetical protein